MKVTLAYPYKNHEADDTIDLPDDEARLLLSDGKARKPTPTRRPRHDSGTDRGKEK